MLSVKLATLYESDTLFKARVFYLPHELQYLVCIYDPEGIRIHQLDIRVSGYSDAIMAAHDALDLKAQEEYDDHQ